MVERGGAQSRGGEAGPGQVGAVNGTTVGGGVYSGGGWGRPSGCSS